MTKLKPSATTIVKIGVIIMIIIVIFDHEQYDCFDHILKKKILFRTEHLRIIGKVEIEMPSWK